MYVWYSWIKQKRHLTKTWVLCLETKFSSPSCHTRVRVCVFIGLGIPQYLTRKWWKSWLKRKVWGPLLRLLPSWPRPGGSLMPGWFAASVDEWMNRQMMDGWIICYAVFYFDTLEYTKLNLCVVKNSSTLRIYFLQSLDWNSSSNFFFVVFHEVGWICILLGTYNSQEQMQLWSQVSHNATKLAELAIITTSALYNWLQWVQEFW